METLPREDLKRKWEWVPMATETSGKAEKETQGVVWIGGEEGSRFLDHLAV